MRKTSCNELFNKTVSVECCKNTLSVSSRCIIKGIANEFIT